MATFQVFSDGAADIPLDMAKENNINIIPFYISLDGKSYKKELFELSHEE
ncbi:MAG: DegV family protein, partial [Anaerotignaceae bacterium]